MQRQQIRDPRLHSTFVRAGRNLIRQPTALISCNDSHRRRLVNALIFTFCHIGLTGVQSLLCDEQHPNRAKPFDLLLLTETKGFFDGSGQF